MKKTVIRLALVLAVSLVLSSCSAERRALGQMRTLTSNVERYGESYDIDDWKEALEDYKAIEKKMDGRKLSSEQQREYGELKGRCVAAFARCQLGNAGDFLRNYLNQGGGMVKGLLEGLGL